MTDLIIIGARAMGRETCTYAMECGMRVKGFLDSDANALSGFGDYPPILSSVEAYVPSEDDRFVCALGDPSWKMRYVRLIAAKGGRFTKVIHPRAYVGHNVKLGVGCIICPNSILANDVELGGHVILNIEASISHDGKCGEGTTLSPGCRIAGRCVIGRRVFMGIGATVIPDVSLGDDVYVAAGACVTKSFSAGRIMGVPARLK